MKKTWEREKAYMEKRAKALGAEMDQAIESADKDRFEKAFVTAMRYMKKKERGTYYRRFIEKMTGRV